MMDADICYPQDCPTCKYYDTCMYCYGKKTEKDDAHKKSEFYADLLMEQREQM